MKLAFKKLTVVIEILSEKGVCSGRKTCRWLLHFSCYCIRCIHNVLKMSASLPPGVYTRAVLAVLLSALPIGKTKCDQQVWGQVTSTAVKHSLRLLITLSSDFVGESCQYCWSTSSSRQINKFASCNESWKNATGPKTLLGADTEQFYNYSTQKEANGWGMALQMSIKYTLIKLPSF